LNTGGAAARPRPQRADPEDIMQFNEFLGQVQHRAQLPSMGHALAATRATLVTLGERLAGGEPADLAAQLPREIAHFVVSGAPDSMGSGQRFDLNEFLVRVSLRENVDMPVAARHAQAVMSVVSEAVSPGEMTQVCGQLPEDIRRLVEGSFPMPEGIAASAASAAF
jgi:uncharacterized protein (DUF2267 family)